MNNMARIGFFFLAIFCSQLASGQNLGILEFTETTHDFGEIKEEDGPAIHEFEFVNKGTAPLLITNVKASCGCTTPDWTREPVMPGEKGFVKAQYNSRNRPGTFRKSLTITTNGQPSVVRAYISGKVIPRVRSIDEQMKVRIGKIGFRHRSINMGRITTEQVVEKSFDIYNASTDTVGISEEYKAPDFIKLSFDTLTLLPGQVSKINISYDPDHEDNLGYNNHGIQIFTDEDNAQEKKLNVLATITEYFPPMNAEERAKAPRLSIRDRLQDLGQLHHGDKAEALFVLSNHGGSTLNIRKIKSNCDCLVADVPVFDIEPGKSLVLKGTFDTTGRRGNQNKSITIYTNDPVDPTQMMSIKAAIIAVK